MDIHGEPLGVVVLYNVSAGLIKGEPWDRLAEEGVTRCAEAVSASLGRGGYRVAQVPIHTDVELALARYAPTEWMVFNLGEGIDGRLFEEPRIVWALEAMGYYFTGSRGNAIARSLHKAHAKELLARNGVATPTWWLFRHADEVIAYSESLSFPLIVKPVAEDASIGIGPGAVVHDVSTLRDRVAYVVELYRQAALVESFIAGREFNVSIWGEPPRVLPVAEINFSAFGSPYTRIVSFAAKWEEESFEYHHTPVVCPASIEEGTATRIRVAAERAWSAIGCGGYARVDIRLDEEEVPFVVEVNCNPDLSPEAGFSRAACAAGYSYDDMVANIVKIARRRQDGGDHVCCGRGWGGYSTHNGNDRHVHAGRGELRRRDMAGVSR